MLDFAWGPRGVLERLLSLICGPFSTMANMTLDEKIRYGMMALAGASVVLATLGAHPGLLEIAGGMGA